MGYPFLQVKSLKEEFYSQAWTQQFFNPRKVYDPSYADSKDADLWEILRRDPIIFAGTQQRFHRVAASTWRIAPPSESQVDIEANSILEDLVRCIMDLIADRKKFAAADFTARAFGLVEGKRQIMNLGGKGAKNWWTPTRIRHVDRRRIKIVPLWETLNNGGKRLKLKMQLWSPARRDWEDIKRPENWIKHIVENDEDRLGYGRGANEALFFLHWAGQIVWKEGLQAIERWGQVPIHIQVDDLREGDETRTLDQVIDEFLTVIDRLRAKNVIVTHQNDKVTPLELSGSSQAMTMDMLKYIDELKLRLITGSVLPSGGGQEVGSNSRAQEESDVSESIYQASRTALDSTLTRDLLSTVWNVNRSNFVELGLATARMGSFETYNEKKENYKENAEILDVVLRRAPVKVDEFYEKTGLHPPGPNDPVIPAGGGGTPAMPGMDPSLMGLPAPGEGSGGGGGDGDDDELDVQDDGQKQQPQKNNAPFNQAVLQFRRHGCTPAEAVKLAIEYTRSQQRHLPEIVPAPAAMAPIIVPAPPTTINMPNSPETLRQERTDMARHFESIVDKMKAPDIHVHVAPSPAPDVKVNVQPPRVVVQAPPPAQVTVQAPPPANVTVQAPPPAQVNVTVEAPKPMEKEIKFLRDENGNIDRAKVKTQPAPEGCSAK